MFIRNHVNPTRPPVGDLKHIEEHWAGIGSDDEYSVQKIKTDGSEPKHVMTRRPWSSFGLKLHDGGLAGTVEMQPIEGQTNTKYAWKALSSSEPENAGFRVYTPLEFKEGDGQEEGSARPADYDVVASSFVGYEPVNWYDYFLDPQHFHISGDIWYKMDHIPVDENDTVLCPYQGLEGAVNAIAQQFWPRWERHLDSLDGSVAGKYEPVEDDPSRIGDRVVGFMSWSLSGSVHWDEHIDLDGSKWIGPMKYSSGKWKSEADSEGLWWECTEKTETLNVVQKKIVGGSEVVVQTRSLSFRGYMANEILKESMLIAPQIIRPFSETDTNVSAYTTSSVWTYGGDTYKDNSGEWQLISSAFPASWEDCDFSSSIEKVNPYDFRLYSAIKSAILERAQAAQVATSNVRSLSEMQVTPGMKINYDFFETAKLALKDVCSHYANIEDEYEEIPVSPEMWTWGNLCREDRSAISYSIYRGYPIDGIMVKEWIYAMRLAINKLHVLRGFKAYAENFSWDSSIGHGGNAQDALDMAYNDITWWTSISSFGTVASEGTYGINGSVTMDYEWTWDRQLSTWYIDPDYDYSCNAYYSGSGFAVKRIINYCPHARKARIVGYLSSMCNHDSINSPHGNNHWDPEVFNPLSSGVVSGLTKNYWDVDFRDENYGSTTYADKEIMLGAFPEELIGLAPGVGPDPDEAEEKYGPDPRVFSTIGYRCTGFFFLDYGIREGFMFQDIPV